LNLVESVKKAEPYLARHGVSSPRLNAELLLAHTIDCSRLDIYTNFDRPLSVEESDAFRDLLVQRASGTPLQHLTGRAGFYGSDFDVGPGVFIPRPETEILVEKALEAVDIEVLSVLDLCTGCGNVAVALAERLPSARVTAVDSSEKAVAVAKRNADRHGVIDRVDFLCGDLYTALPATTGGFDLLVANPPYVSESEYARLPCEVRDHEPREALLAGVDGLDVIRRIVDGARDALGGRGTMLLEIGESQWEAVQVVLAGFDEVTLFHDLNSRPRVVSARLPGARREGAGS